MKVNLEEFLKEYTTDIPESLKKGDIYKLTYTQKLDGISMYAVFPSLLEYNDIIEFEKKLEAVLNLDKFRLYPRYDEKLFTPAYFNTLIQMLKRDVALVNGFLDNAEYSLIDSVLNITLTHGGLDILKKSDFSNKLSKLIYNQFALRIKITLNGESSVSNDEYDKMLEQMASEMPDYSSQLIPEKTAEEKLNEEKANAIPSQSIDSDSLNLDFIAESAEIIKGRAIRNKPISISEAINNQGEKVVIVGDVFSTEIKELRNERKAVTFAITDFGASVLVKIFGNNADIDALPLGNIKNGTTLLVSGKIDYDQYAHDIVIKADSIIKVKRTPKQDR
jgi:DNA polymerase-3 subunit alpha (Gram-positive type)